MHDGRATRTTRTQAIRTGTAIAVAERECGRVIGSIRRECLDHVIVMNAAGLHRLLRDYVSYYMRSRTHLGLDKDTPCPRTVTPSSAGLVIPVAEVGGLHHRYDRIAA